MENILDVFINHIAHNESLADNSLKSYSSQIRGYLSYLESEKLNITAASQDSIRAYFEHKKKLGHEHNSIFQSLLAIKKFHRFLFKTGRVKADGSKGIHLKKKKPKLPQPLTFQEITKLLRPLMGKDFVSIRNQAVFETMYATGVRVSELVGLDLGDIDLDNNWIRVLGKGSKERYIPLTQVAKESIKNYLGGREDEYPTAGKALFLNLRGKRLNRGGIWWLLRERAKQAGISGRIFPHRLRHTTATHLLSQGAAVRVIPGNFRASVHFSYTKLYPCDTGTTQENLQKLSSTVLIIY